MNLKKKFLLGTIPHREQRYNTVGDWIEGEYGKILVSELGNEDWEFLVMVHELIEMYLCRKAGITQAEIDRFDIQYELERKLGQHGKDEPGFDRKAPYRNQHAFATKVERMLAKKLGVDWNKYENKINKL